MITFRKLRVNFEVKIGICSNWGAVRPKFYDLRQTPWWSAPIRGKNGVLLQKNALPHRSRLFWPIFEIFLRKSRKWSTFRNERYIWKDSVFDAEAFEANYSSERGLVFEREPKISAPISRQHLGSRASWRRNLNSSFFKLSESPPHDFSSLVKAVFSTGNFAGIFHAVTKVPNL